MNEIETVLATAASAYNKGNLAQTDILCRTLLARGVESPAIYCLLAKVAVSLRLSAFALEYCNRAYKTDPASEDVAATKAMVDESIEAFDATSSLRHEINAVQGKRFLYIKSWGFGFWSDVDHVVGQLLVAELSNRTPVVHWGLNSMFRDAHSRNAFIDYFEPVSGRTVKDVIDPDFSYFPPKWNHRNLLVPEHQKWSGQYSRYSGIHFLNRPENVVVSDFHTYLSDLIPWIPSSHHLAGMDAEHLYRHLFRKHIHLNPDLSKAIERFRKDRLDGNRVLAVHVRGSDKITECANLETLHNQYFPIVDSYLNSGRVSHLFLLTDSKPVLERYTERYGSQLIVTQCRRSDNEVGVHHQHIPERSELAREIILDTYLAAHCDYFLGIGDSNVSTTIMHLKDWKPGHAMLLGRIHCYEPHTYLYDW